MTFLRVFTYTVESGYNENRYNENSVTTNKFSNYGWFVCLIHSKNFGCNEIARTKTVNTSQKYRRVQRTHNMSTR